ncbi:MAG: hypothetical protein AAFQ66_15095, partial [Pseudomonadota bacterium]
MFFRRFFYSFLSVACALLLGAGAALAQAGSWQFVVDPNSGIGSTDAIAPSGPQLALRCLPPDRRATVPGYDSRPGVLTLLIAPTRADAAQNATRQFVFEVDGRAVSTLPMEFRPELGAVSAPLIMFSPLIERIKAGSVLSILDWQGERRTIGLTGSRAALESLLDYCRPTDAQQAAIPLPGFSCSTARSPTEVALCTVPALAEADRAMSAAFQRARSAGGDVSSLTREQAAWISRREGCAGDPACIQSQTNARQAALEAVTKTAQAPQPAPQAPSPAQPALQTFNVTGADTTAASPSQNPTAIAPTGPTLSGPSVGQRLGLWLIGNRPTMTVDLRLQQSIRSAGLPQGFPTLPANVNDRQTLALYYRSIAQQAASLPFPERITVDVAVNLYRPDTNAPVEMRFSQGRDATPNLQLQPTKPAALRTLHIQPPYRTGPVRLAETAPLPLPLPDTIRNLKGDDRTGFGPGALFQGERTFIRFTISLADPKVTLPIDAQTGARGSQQAGEAQMTVLEAAIYRQKPTRSNEPAAPEILMHRWTRGEGAAISAEAGDMDDLSTIAERYDLVATNDRLVHVPGIYRTQFGLPASGGNWREGAAPQAAALTMRIAALLNENPERTLDQEVVLGAAFTALTPLERDTVLPVGFQSSAQA